MYICACGCVEEYVCVDMRGMRVSMYVCKSTCLSGKYMWTCMYFLSHALSLNLSSGPNAQPKPQC